MSLRVTLNQIIKERSPGILTLGELEALCHAKQYKLSNAERRLRASESPNIEPVYKDHAIVGYRWKQSEAVASFMREWGPKVEPVKTGQGVLL